MSELMKCHKTKRDGVLMSPKGRAVFTAIASRWRGKDAKPDDKGSYNLSLVFPPEANLKLLKDLCNEVAREKWGSGIDLFDKKKSKGLKNPFLDAADKYPEGMESKKGHIELDGWTLVRANTWKQQPTVRGPDAEVIDIDELEVEVYSGRWMRAELQPHTYESKGNKGVSLWLGAVQVLQKDTKLGTSAAASDGDDFKAVDEEMDDDEDDDLN